MSRTTEFDEIVQELDEKTRLFLQGQIDAVREELDWINLPENRSVQKRAAFRQHLPPVPEGHHDCGICRMAHKAEEIKGKLSDDEDKEFIEHLLNCIEAAETDRDMLAGKIQEAIGSRSLYQSGVDRIKEMLINRGDYGPNINRDWP